MIIFRKLVLIMLILASSDSTVQENIVTNGKPTLRERANNYYQKVKDYVNRGAAYAKNNIQKGVKLVDQGRKDYLYDIKKEEDGRYTIEFAPPSRLSNSLKMASRKYVLIPMQEYYKNGLKTNVALPKTVNRMVSNAHSAMKKIQNVLINNDLYSIMKTEQGELILTMNPAKNYMPDTIKNNAYNYVMVPFDKYYNKGYSTKLPRMPSFSWKHREKTQSE